MTGDSEIVTFTLLGQTFRIRAGHEQAVRARRVADGLAKRLSADGAGVDVRSALMAAYGAAYELDEMTEALHIANNSHDLTLESARSAMERLLSRVDAELTPTEEVEEERPAVPEPLAVVPEPPPVPEEEIASVPDSVFVLPEESVLSETAADEDPSNQEDAAAGDKTACKSRASRKPKSDIPDMFNALFAVPPEDFHNDPRSMEP